MLNLPTILVISLIIIITLLINRKKWFQKEVDKNKEFMDRHRAEIKKRVSRYYKGPH